MAVLGGWEIIDDTSPALQEETRQNTIDAYLREYQAAEERELTKTMDAVAETLREEFGVDVNDVEGTRHQRSEPAAVEVERAVPVEPQMERAVAPAQKTTAAKKGTAASIRGGSRAGRG